MQKVKAFKTRTAEISLENNLYIRIKVLPGAVIDKEDALDNMLVIKNLAAGKKMLKLIDLRGRARITPDARKVAEKNVGESHTRAAAYIIDSFLTKITLQFLKAFSRSPGIPQEFFRNEKQALDWLLQFPKK